MSGELILDNVNQNTVLKPIEGTPELVDQHRRCKFCKYWEADGNRAEQGSCHFDPPRTFIVPAKVQSAHGMSANIMAAFPPCVGMSWCGKFEKDDAKVLAVATVGAAIVS